MRRKALSPEEQLAKVAAKANLNPSLISRAAKRLSTMSTAEIRMLLLKFSETAEGVRDVSAPPLNELISKLKAVSSRKSNADLSQVLIQELEERRLATDLLTLEYRPKETMSSWLGRLSTRVPEPVLRQMILETIHGYESGARLRRIA